MKQFVACLSVLVLVISSTPVMAQTGGVLGCSIVPESWATVQQGLDKLFLGACSRHDLCYRICNPISGPYVGYSYKINCDNQFLVDLLAACGAWALILSFPNIEWVDSNDFLNECADYAAYGYALVATYGNVPFVNNQCLTYCNAWACGQLGLGPNTHNNAACHWECGFGWSRGDLDDRDTQPWMETCPQSPIGLDLQGNGFKLTGPRPPVYFDLNADGEADHTSWTRVETKDGFLVLDRNQNGVIENGVELFGTAAPLLLSSARPLHGYEVLAEFDDPILGGNGDQVIDQHDAIFAHLGVWLDKNRDAVTQEGEVVSLAEAGVEGISLAYFESDETDQWGNEFKWWSPIYLDDGRISMSVDIFFARQ